MYICIIKYIIQVIREEVRNFKVKEIEMKKEDNTFKLEKKTEKRILNDIKEYFLEMRDEELSDLEALLILDFFREKVASEFYNLGIVAAYNRLHEISEDILSIQKI